MPESVKWRGSSGPTIGAIVRRSSCSGEAAMAPRTLVRGRSLRPMQVRVRLFAQLRERAGGRRELELELPEGALVRDALAAVDDLAAGLPLVMAVNREYANEDAELHPGDELALVPP